MRPALALVALLAIPVVPAPAHAAETKNATVASFQFSPDPVQIKAGDSVKWTWTGDNHSVTSDTGAFDSHPTVCPPTCGMTGDTFTHTFPTVGAFAYHCKVHGSMTASVQVTAAATSPSPTPPTTTRPPTTRPPTTQPPTTKPPTTASRTPSPTVAPTTASPTPSVTVTPSVAPSPTTAAPTPSPTESTAAPVVELDDEPAADRTGLAILLGGIVAAAGFGAGAWLLLRNRP